MANDGIATMMVAAPVSLLLVDDNAHLATALAKRLVEEGISWRGHLMRVDFLRVHVQAECPDLDIVLLDLDMPGKDPLAELPAFSARCPTVRTIIFTAYCTKELVETAMRAGARGYVCKVDGEESLIEGIDSVMADQVYLSPQARMVQQLD